MLRKISDILSCYFVIWPLLCGVVTVIMVGSLPGVSDFFFLVYYYYLICAFFYFVLHVSFLIILHVVLSRAAVGSPRYEKIVFKASPFSAFLLTPVQWWLVNRHFGGYDPDCQSSIYSWCGIAPSIGLVFFLASLITGCMIAYYMDSQTRSVTVSCANHPKSGLCDDACCIPLPPSF